MVKASKMLRVSILPLVLGTFGQWKIINHSEDTLNSDTNNFIDDLCYEFPNEDISESTDASYQLFLEKDYLGFKEAVAFKESRGRYGVVNRFGYLGKYQFAKGTLALVGVNDTKQFLNSPAIQEKAFKANVSRNKWVLRKYIDYFEGKKVGGVLVTESGILAAAHLGGPGAIKKFLSSNGEIRFKDGLGTSIVEYMNKFKSYDMSDIPRNRKAKVRLEPIGLL